MLFRWLWALHPGLYIAVVAGAIVAVIGFGTWIYKSIEGRGYDKAIAEVAAKNKGAIANVRKATKNVSDCYSISGNWRADLGVCE